VILLAGLKPLFLREILGQHPPAVTVGAGAVDGADPAVASSVFVTMVTDSMGFLAVLGLATAGGIVP
jgi:hypothetical protein